MEAGYITENIRYLLWHEREKIARKDWPSLLGSWAGIEPGRAEEILHGADIGMGELGRIAAVTGVAEDVLRFGRLLEESSTNIWQENLCYLFGDLEHGMHKKVAKHLRVHWTTISRWLGGTHRPSDRHFKALADFFSLPSTTDLTMMPLFLSPSPVTEFQQRKWLHDRIDMMPSERLRKVYPGLEDWLKQR